MASTVIVVNENFELAASYQMMGLLSGFCWVLFLMDIQYKGQFFAVSVHYELINF